MKDLEIRGAGNLLGGEQSGHIADVGFDLYVRMVGEALAEVKGEVDTESIEVLVELPVDAHPRVLRARSACASRLTKALHRSGRRRTSKPRLLNWDRYGQFPAPVETLFEVARLRLLARKAGLSEVVVAGSRIRFRRWNSPTRESCDSRACTRDTNQASDSNSTRASASHCEGRRQAAHQSRTHQLGERTHRVRLPLSLTGCSCRPFRLS